MRGSATAKKKMRTTPRKEGREALDILLNPAQAILKAGIAIWHVQLQ